ncbi:hypothetical protein SBFV3_gp39 [Sulfolobales Beppu filamentous virus 3]|uniref:Uncharacterized protein n=1 Tax=Sulfolobales Beppu filamentous virus 3 TaxID=2493124 RepID=A0A3Q8Q3V0_9VIRU|nr:hypothetical protein HOU83_gp39 [Sulfolobales Beppu filamentous virus 3]AZI75874.1 hypothetical protein SBFV3_gp39 [Sulfolobales Beppu filamentous virus 3]
MSSSGSEEGLDLAIVIGLIAIAISIIFAYVVNPSLSQNTQLTQIVYIIVTGIVSILSYITGKNRRS